MPWPTLFPGPTRKGPGNEVVPWLLPWQHGAITEVPAEARPGFHEEGFNSVGARHARGHALPVNVECGGRGGGGAYIKARGKLGPNQCRCHSGF